MSSTMPSKKSIVLREELQLMAVSVATSNFRVIVFDRIVVQVVLILGCMLQSVDTEFCQRQRLRIR